MDEYTDNLQHIKWYIGANGSDWLCNRYFIIIFLLNRSD
jgi:hypothetical protein